VQQRQALESWAYPRRTPSMLRAHFSPRSLDLRKLCSCEAARQALEHSVLREGKGLRSHDNVLGGFQRCHLHLHSPEGD
jgi:hypothetical protein